MHSLRVLHLHIPMIYDVQSVASFMSHVSSAHLTLHVLFSITGFILFDPCSSSPPVHKTTPYHQESSSACCHRSKTCGDMILLCFGWALSQKNDAHSWHIPGTMFQERAVGTGVSSTRCVHRVGSVNGRQAQGSYLLLFFFSRCHSTGWCVCGSTRTPCQRHISRTWPSRSGSGGAG